MKSEKAWMSLLFTSSLLLFTCPALAAVPADTAVTLGEVGLPVYMPSYGGAFSQPSAVYPITTAGAPVASEEKVTSVSTKDMTMTWTLAAWTLGRTLSEQSPDANLGDFCTDFPIDEAAIDWAKTIALKQNADAVAAGRILFNPGAENPSDRLIFTAIGATEVTWVATTGGRTPRTYAIGSSSPVRPYRIFATRAGETDSVAFVDLSGKFVEFFGDQDVLTSVYGETEPGVTNVVYGLDYDPSKSGFLTVRYTVDETTGEIRCPQGQFVMAYYDSAAMDRVVAHVTVEVCPPHVTTLNAEVGECLRPAVDDGGKGRLGAVVVAGLAHDPDDPWSPYLEQYAAAPGEELTDPDHGKVVAVEATDRTTSPDGVDMPWKADIYWQAEDAMKTRWAFEHDWYLISRPENPPPVEPVAYLDWDEVGKTLTNAICTAYEEYTGQTVLEAGMTYVVKGEVASVTRIVVNGTEANQTRLILCDGAKLTASAGVTVTVSDGTPHALVICGQAGGTGALEATGGSRGAGIGGVSGACGRVTINGGTVTATGGNYSAGIGGGFRGAGGTVTINGGTVTAMGGADDQDGSTAAIGGGQMAASHGTLTFGEGFAGGVAAGADAASAGYLTTAAYAADHCAKYVTMPQLALKIPVTTGCSHVVSNETAELTSSLMGGFNTYALAPGATGVKVIFTPEDNYRFVDAGETGVQVLDSPLTMDYAVTPPEVEGIPGTIANPWTVGAGATAYVKDGTLHVDGAGAVTSMPWAENADGITKLVVADGVTGMRELVRSLPDLAVANGLTCNELNGLAVGVLPADIAAAKVDAATQEATITVEVKTTETETNQVWKTVVTTNIVVPVEAPVGYLKLVTKPAEEE